MRNIIVPTDFSDNAANALRFAINIANHFQSKIHLIHVFEVINPTGVLKNMRNFLRADVEQRLSEVLKENKVKLFHETHIEGKAIEGGTVNGISRYAKGIEADLIIMGTQGASGLKEMFMGSNTAGLIKKTNVPILAIPNEYSYEPLTEITLAIDSSTMSNEDVVAPLIKLAKAYKSSVKVLHVEKVNEVATIDAGVDIYLSDVNHSFHLVEDDRINESINKFVKENDAKLLCMVHRERGFWGNLFHRSVTEKEAFSCTVPLLILSDKY